MRGPQRSRRTNVLSIIFLMAVIVRPGRTQSDFDKYLASAEERLRKQDLRGAEKLLVAAEKLDPKSFVVHNNLGALYLQQRRYADSIRELTAARTLSPDNFDVLRNLGTSHFLAGDYKGALEPLMRSKELDAGDLRTHYQLGYSLLMLDRPTEAQPELEKVHAVMPADANTLFALIKVYQAERDQTRAGRTFADLQRAHPESVFVHVLLGESYDVQENWPAAISEFQKAIEEAPSMPRLHFDLGFMYWQSAQYPKAVEEFKKELEISPGFVPALYYLGDIALNGGDASTALKYFQSATVGNPSCLDPFVGQGKAYMGLGRPEQALGQFQRAAGINEDQPDVYYLIAGAYRRLGQTQRSQEAMAKFQLLSDKSKKESVPGEPGRARWSTPACMSGWGGVQQ